MPDENNIELFYVNNQVKKIAKHYSPIYVRERIMEEIYLSDIDGPIVIVEVTFVDGNLCFRPYNEKDWQAINYR